MDKTSTQKLYNYLESFGILTCNSNPYLPSIVEIGCTWNDVTNLIDSHDIFYCKAFRNRTTYLSKPLYFHLKNIYNRKILSENATRIYRILYNNPPISTTTLKRIPSLPTKEYTVAINELLESMYITAIHNDRKINTNWSSFLYGTFEEWEKITTPVNLGKKSSSLDYVITILSKTMSEKELNKFLKLS